MDWAMALFVLSSVAGFVLVTGSLILLWKGRIILDTEGKSVSQVELPLGFKFSTQFPVLIMFFFGVFLLIFPVYYDKNVCPDLLLHKKTFPEMVAVTGKVSAPTGVDVYAVVDVQNNAQNEVALRVPFRQDARYRVVFSANNLVLDSDSFILEKLGPVTLRDRILQSPGPSTPAIDTSRTVQKVTAQEESNFKKSEEQQ